MGVKLKYSPTDSISHEQRVEEIKAIAHYTKIKQKGGSTPIDVADEANVYMVHSRMYAAQKRKEQKYVPFYIGY